MSAFSDITDTELDASLALALSGDGHDPASRGHVRAFREYIASCAVPWMGLAAHDRDRVAAAAIALLPPGRTAAVLTAPPGRLGIDPHGQEALTSQLLARLGERRLYYAQALVSEGADPRRNLLERLGFWRLAGLRYMERDTSYPWVEPPADPGVEWITFDASSAAEFAATIEATYADSRDCPRLTGLRPIAEIVAGHQAAGPFDPAFWFVARVDGRPAGCLLLSRLAHTTSVELVYMGVAPQARRRELGSLLLRRALDTCRRAAVRRLALAVDASNDAALRLYRRFDFYEIAARDAFLYQWVRIAGADC